ncbi:MAG: helix-turn-helix domain-containing protein [Treponema sp.]|nr:helix-turn-helix domain-containing protein [Treponema sp.]
MGFRENLKQELSYNDMLVKELALASGVHKRAIDMYLCEKASMPSADAAVSIARALGVTVEYLVTGEEPALPRDVRLISRNLLKLSEKDRKVVSAMVRTMVEQREEP